MTIENPNLRVCAWPGCSASYDVWEVMTGRERVTGWLRHAGFMFSLCGPHAVKAWGPDRSRHLASGSRGRRCGCGTELQPDGPTLGDLSAAYLRHLVAAVEEESGGE